MSNNYITNNCIFTDGYCGFSDEWDGKAEIYILSSLAVQLGIIGFFNQFQNKEDLNEVIGNRHNKSINQMLKKPFLINSVEKHQSDTRAEDVYYVKFSTKKEKEEDIPITIGICYVPSGKNDLNVDFLKQNVGKEVYLNENVMGTSSAIYHEDRSSIIMSLCIKDKATYLDNKEIKFVYLDASEIESFELKCPTPDRINTFYTEVTMKSGKIHKFLSLPTELLKKLKEVKK